MLQDYRHYIETHMGTIMLVLIGVVGNKAPNAQLNIIVHIPVMSNGVLCGTFVYMINVLY